MSNALVMEAMALEPMVEEIFYTLHRHPELGDEEYATSALVKTELEKMGIEAVPMAGTGVKGVIRGGKPGKTVAFRQPAFNTAMILIFYRLIVLLLCCGVAIVWA